MPSDNFSDIIALFHIKEMKPVEMVILKQKEWGEGFLTAGLCSDIITNSL